MQDHFTVANVFSQILPSAVQGRFVSEANASMKTDLNAFLDYISVAISVSPCFPLFVCPEQRILVTNASLESGRILPKDQRSWTVSVSMTSLSNALLALE